MKFLLLLISLTLGMNSSFSLAGPPNLSAWKPTRLKLVGNDGQFAFFLGALAQENTLRQYSHALSALLYSEGMKEKQESTATFPETDGITLQQVVYLLQALHQEKTNKPNLEKDLDAQVAFILENGINSHPEILENVDSLLFFSHQWLIQTLERASAQALCQAWIQNHLSSSPNSGELNSAILTWPAQHRKILLRELVGKYRELNLENAKAVLDFFSLIHQSLGEESPYGVSLNEIQLFLKAIQNNQLIVYTEKEIAAFHSNPRRFMTDLTKIHRDAQMNLYDHHGEVVFTVKRRDKTNTLFTDEEIQSRSFLDMKSDAGWGLLGLDIEDQQMHPIAGVHPPQRRNTIFSGLSEYPESLSYELTDYMQRTDPWSGLDFPLSDPAFKNQVIQVMQKYENLIGISTTRSFNPLWQEISPARARKLWAASTFIVNKPRSSIRVKSLDGKEDIEFSPSELQILYSIYAMSLDNELSFQSIGLPVYKKNPVEDKNGRIIDSSYPALSPVRFHQTMLQHFHLQRKHFVLSSSYDPYLTHQPVKSYYYEYFNPMTGKIYPNLESAKIYLQDYTRDPFRPYRSPKTHSVVGVLVHLKIIDPLDLTRGSQSTSESSHEVTYYYDLELNSDNQTLGGQWYHQAPPDLLWTPNFRKTTCSELDQIEWKNRALPIPPVWQETAERIYIRQHGKILPQIIQCLGKWAHVLPFGMVEFKDWPQRPYTPLHNPLILEEGQIREMNQDGDKEDYLKWQSDHP